MRLLRCIRRMDLGQWQFCVMPVLVATIFINEYLVIVLMYTHLISGMIHHQTNEIVKMYKTDGSRSMVVQCDAIIQLMHSFEVDIRICQPENSDVHRGEAEVNITFEGWLILMLTEKECTNCFVIWHCLSFPSFI